MSQFHTLTKTQPESVTSLHLPENTACVLLRKREISVQPTPLPILQPDGVLVKVVATGICGSDLHNYLAGGVGGRPVTEPLVMGHESAGEVIAVGEMVTSHKVGDRVAVEPGLPCRRCANCKAGRMNICTDVKYCGSPGSVGSLSRFFAVPADMAPHLPDGLSWTEAGCVQPLAIGVQIGIRADIRAHQSVAIMGTGPIGLIAAAVCRAYGCAKIIGFEIRQNRVDFAREYRTPKGEKVFDDVFLVDALPSTTADLEAEKEAEKASKSANGCNGNGHSHGPVPPDDDVPPGDIKFEAAKLRAATYLSAAGMDPEGVDRVIEASGAEDAGMLGVAIARQGGIYLAVGLGHHQTNAFPTLAVTNKELEVRGITRYTSTCFPHALDLLRRKQVDLAPLITLVLPLRESQAAFEAVASGEQIKVVIMNQEV